MSSILKERKVADSIIYSVVELSKNVIDLRGIKSGDNYTLFYSPEPEGDLNYLVYEPNKIDFVVLDLKYPVRVEKRHKETDTLKISASGIIENSLWETMVDLEANPELVFMMSEIFAWQVDFYHLQKGDRFRILYDRVNVDGKPFSISEIHAALFEHAGEQFYAFKFNTDSITGYFDEVGNSLRKQLLKTPLKFYRVTSRYRGQRFHPVQGRYKAHLGTDYAAPSGTPIRSVGDGVVTEAAYTKNNGNYIKIRHNGVYTTQYLHMSGFAKGIKYGVSVRQGQTIGYVGSTGLATGPHVCYRFWVNGRQVDAQKQKLPPSDPIPEYLKKEFFIIRDSLKEKLDSIGIFQYDLATRESIPEFN
jgi:murein DD-endopeptidase MepM/ murein hydrolase activator NlpD